MGRRINLDDVPEWYDPYELKAQFFHSGYDEYGRAACEILQVSAPKTARKKINKAVLSHADTLILAKALNMSPRDYLRVFCKGYFDE